MRMVVKDGVTLVKPLADGRDYSAGEVIDLQDAVAQDYQRRGWVRPFTPVPSGYARKSKGVHD